MNILNEFGLNPVLLIAQVINFLIILFILKKYLYKPVLTMLAKRQNSIKQGLLDSEEAKLLLQETEEKEKAVLRAAGESAKKIVDDTKKQKGQLLKEAEIMAKKKVDEMLKDAKLQITFETREAEKRLSLHISQLAIDFLEQSLTDVFSESEQDIIVKRAVGKLKKKAN